MKPNKKAQDMTVAELAAYIDQSVLKPEFTQAEIRRYIQEGIDFGCKTVCINPASIAIADAMCRGTQTKLCVVCDFPFGLSTTESKVMQADLYCKKGNIFELDMVANYGWIRSGMWGEVEKDIKAVSDVCHQYGTAVKVIFETDALTLEEVRKATETAIAAGADFAERRGQPAQPHGDRGGHYLEAGQDPPAHPHWAAGPDLRPDAGQHRAAGTDPPPGQAPPAGKGRAAFPRGPAPGGPGAGDQRGPYQHVKERKRKNVRGQKENRAEPIKRKGTGKQALSRAFC